MSDFTADEWLRYTRHIQLPQIGAEGQSRLKNARVLIVGAGGLGSPVSLYLAAAGIGHITIVDGDTVDLSNLQRQILFTTEQVGQSKARCAKARLLALNSDITVNALEEHLSLDNALALIEPVDLVVDCTDNFATRYLINDSCLRLKTPWLFASIYQFSGQCALFMPAKSELSACFRCLFPEKPSAALADCNTAGVLGVLPGLLGTIQANEAIKYLAGLPCVLDNTLLMVEANDLEFKKIKLTKNKQCPLCAQTPDAAFSLPLEDYILKSDETACAIGEEGDLTTAQFIRYKDEPHYYLLDVREEKERACFHIGGAHIPLSELESALPTLDKNKTILCYCQSGARSAKARALLKQHHFRAVHLDNGLAALLKFEHQRKISEKNNNNC